MAETPGERMPRLDEQLDAALRRDAYSAAVVLVADEGRIVGSAAVGTTRAWDAPGRPAEQHGPAGIDTVFDLASITKLVTAATLLALLERRGADASLEAAEALPEFREPALARITAGQLLAHTAGFPAEWHDRRPDPDARRFRAGARPVDPPGTVHRYSCVGYLWAGLLAEALGDAPLDRLARELVLDPVGMPDTGFRPAPALRDRIAATEWQHEPPRGLVHGEVHDETAWALGGVAGNAGLFGTAPELLRFAEALRGDGVLEGRRVLPASVARAMTRPVPLPGPADYRQALGPRIDEEWMLGLGPGPVAGHTGFTGTALATQPGGRSSVVFLTNRVHPARTSTEALAMRGRIARAAAALRGTT